jgi:hypothetical protein
LWVDPKKKYGNILERSFRGLILWKGNILIFIYNYYIYSDTFEYDYNDGNIK